MAKPYDPYLADQVVEMVSNGFTLEQIETLSGFPSRSDFLRWKRNDANLAEKYRQAVADRVGLFFDRAFVLTGELMRRDEEAPVYTEAQLRQFKMAFDTLSKVLTKGSVDVLSGQLQDGKKQLTVPRIEIGFVGAPKNMNAAIFENEVDDPES